MAEATTALKPGTNRVSFENAHGETLAAILDWPDVVGERPKGVAVFAHCFTCSKDLPITFRISRLLAEKGFAVLRFDFTGLGHSAGNFADTNFSSNVDDLLAATRFAGEIAGPPDILIGHSLGGAASLAAAGQIPGLKGVVTIAAPSDPHHIGRLLENDREVLEAGGEAEIEVGGRRFTIRKHFLEDIQQQNVLARLHDFDGSVMIMHSPVDETVSIDHAAEIYSAARHPKSFVSLANADHLLSRPEDSEFAGEMIAAWAKHLCLD